MAILGDFRQPQKKKKKVFGKKIKKKSCTASHG
jgi:hypothetical protein